MTRDEFVKWWSKDGKRSVDGLTAHQCHCGQLHCRGWVMLPDWYDAEDIAAETAPLPLDDDTMTEG